MSGIVQPFGSFEGTAIHEVTLRTEGGFSASIITWGAVLRDLVVPTPSGLCHVVLGFDRFDDYLAQGNSFGAIVGRYANRIAGARFRLGGETFALQPNENGNQLHGGAKGFGRTPWTLVAHDGHSVTLQRISPDGEMGYPGRLVARCTYRLVAPATLRIELEATSDRATPVNLTTHSYYNLDGSPDILGHRVTLHAEHITPTDAGQIPTGEIRAVAGGSYDFRTERVIGTAADYDINYVLARPREAGLWHAASIRPPKGSLALQLWTTEPGLQFYSGHKIAPGRLGHGGRTYGRNSGLALEPQRFPDGPNRSYFPPCILEPGETSRQVSEIRFSS